VSRALRMLGLGSVFALTLASADPVDLTLGTLVGGALLLALGDRLRLGPAGPLPPFAQRVVWFPVFAGAIVADVVQGTWEVALRVLHARRLEQPGLVRIPIGERSERGVAVSALATTLSPGTVLVDVDWERRDLLLHVIDASDPDAVRARLQRFYDRFQRKVFP
jgi:multicomponent K+:H+ antiporter subunit E/multicomponent Na+:H+ antiporter subunit E